MKSFLTFCLSFFVCLTVHAQTTIYLDTINSTGSNWTLNTSDLGGVTTGTPNHWVINNSYLGGTILVITVAPTPDQPSGITGYPESYYLHIDSKQGETNGFYNCNYNASGTHSYFAAMNNSIITTGYSNVTLTFWYLCTGSANSFGQIYYRTSAAGAWTQISTMSAPPAALDSYNVHPTWTLTSGIHLDSFDNQAFLQFAFRFKHNASGNDPAFGVDDIKVTGITSGTAPVASFTTTATTVCQDSCLTFTSTTTGTVDSVRWTASPAGPAITSPTSNSTSVCFPASGTYSVILTAYNSGGSNSASSAISVTPTPHPVITQVGDVLSVPSGYTNYQWYNGTTAISGATTNTYTITATGLYGIVVDSAGCPGIDTLTGTLHIITINNLASNYWVAQSTNNSINVNASKPLEDNLAIIIFDATGRKIVDAIWNAGSYTKQIDNLSIAKGLYFIKLSNSYTSAVIKWLKQ